MSRSIAPSDIAGPCLHCGHQCRVAELIDGWCSNCNKELTACAVSDAHAPALPRLAEIAEQAEREAALEPRGPIPFLPNSLPAPISHFQDDFYGNLLVPVKDLLYVVHITAGTPHDGSGTVNYMHSITLRWHRTVGTSGIMWRCTKAWGQPDSLLVGAHDAGINTRSVGCEHTGNCGSDFRNYPLMLNASARELALFAIHVKKQRPARGKPVGDGWVIGHIDDGYYGGTSAHVDPTCGHSAPPPWPWAEYMVLCNQWYDHLTGQTPEEEFLMSLDSTEQAELLSNSRRSSSASLAFTNGFDFSGDPEKRPKKGTDRIGWAHYIEGAQVRAANDPAAAPLARRNIARILQEDGALEAEDREALWRGGALL